VWAKATGRAYRGCWPGHHYDTPQTAAPWNGIPVKLYNYNHVTGQIGNLLGQDVTHSLLPGEGSGYYEIWWNAYSGNWYCLKATADSPLLRLSGNWVSISTNDDITLSHPFQLSGSSYSHSWNFVTDETNVFHHANRIHNFFKGSPFNYNDMDYQMIAYVHHPMDNAWSDGTNIGFGDINSGPFPWNGHHWARSSDIVYHEYTHCVIYHLYDYNWIDAPRDGGQDYAMDEGFADYFACTINDDPIQGESVDVGRNLNNSLKYPDNYTGEGHHDGQIIAGACWDVRESLGQDVTDFLVFKTLQEEPQPDSFVWFAENMIKRDDDYYGDGDYTNGSPHHYVICPAFQNHGIPVPNQCPQITSGPTVGTSSDGKRYENISYSASVSAFDNDGDPLTYKWDVLGRWWDDEYGCWRSGYAGTISGSGSSVTYTAPNVPTSGKAVSLIIENKVEVTVSDRCGGSDSDATGWFRIQDGNPPQPPGCPFVYCWNGSAYVEDNNILAASEIDSCEVTEYYRLEQTPVKEQNRYFLQIREFEQEHTYLDKIELLAIDHTCGVKVGVTTEGDIVVYDDELLPIDCVDTLGQSHLGLILERDSTYFQGFPGDELVIDFGEIEVNSEDALHFVIVDKPPGPQPEASVMVSVYKDGDWHRVGRLLHRRNWWSQMVYPLEKGSQDSLKVKLTWY